MGYPPETTALTWIKSLLMSGILWQFRTLGKWSFIHSFHVCVYEYVKWISVTVTKYVRLLTYTSSLLSPRLVRCIALGIWWVCWVVMVYVWGGGVVSRENFPPHGKETKKGKGGAEISSLHRWLKATCANMKNISLKTFLLKILPSPNNITLNSNT